jgi:hypothetical protein
VEHDLRDITAHCQAEREHRMALEALGGKYLQLLLNFVLTSGSLPLTTTPLSQMSLIGTIT